MSISGDDTDLPGIQPDELMNPFMIDGLIRQAFLMCWMTLPKERRTIDEVLRIVRRMYERNETSFREDAKLFHDEIPK